jgi:hypothetical protein
VFKKVNQQAEKHVKLAAIVAIAAIEVVAIAAIEVVAIAAIEVVAIVVVAAIEDFNFYLFFIF